MNTAYEPKTQLFLLRHGSCEGGRIFRGLNDVALTNEGFQQMTRSCQQAHQAWDLIVSSPLQRCRRFAEAYAAEAGIPLHIDDRLREMSFGEWEGRLIDEIWASDHQSLKAWSENPERNTPPSGEPLADVAQRLLAAYADWLKSCEGKTLLFVMHGGVIRVLMASLLNIPLAFANHFEVPYASMSQLDVLVRGEGSIVKLHRHNFTQPDSDV